jgi:RNA recognition motif-containing protein
MMSFGFVEMTDDDAAAKAVERFNGKEVNGRALTVNEARPMERRSSGDCSSGFEAMGTMFRSSNQIKYE